MIKDFKSIMGAKVLEFDSGSLLAVVSGIIVNPDFGMVEAYWVKPFTLPFRNAILRSGDILEFKKNLYIKSDKTLAQSEDVIRIKEILEDGRKFIGNSVRNEAGKSYGTCVNLTFETETYALKQVYSRKSFLGLITLDERIFSYNDIVRVLPEAILVNDDATKKEVLMVTTPEAAVG